MFKVFFWSTSVPAPASSSHLVMRWVVRRSSHLVEKCCTEQVSQDTLHVEWFALRHGVVQSQQRFQEELSRLSGAKSPCEDVKHAQSSHNGQTWRSRQREQRHQVRKEKINKRFVVELGEQRRQKTCHCVKNASRLNGGRWKGFSREWSP